MNCHSLLRVLCLLCGLIGGQVSEAANLTGVVKDASSRPVSGALVKVSGVDTGLSYLVVSRDQGRYHTPQLLAGRYTIHALGGHRQSEVSKTVEISGDEQVDADLVLNSLRTIPPAAEKMTNADYEELMPEGEARNLIASRCVMCHGLDRIVPARKPREAWQVTVNRMAFFLEEREDLGGPFTSREKQAILDYLSTNFTRDTPRIPEFKPADPNQHLPAELLEGAESGFVVMEFDPGTDADRLEIGVDAEGKPWLSEGGKPYYGWFDPASLRYYRVETPPGRYPRDLGQIAVVPDGLVWGLDNGPAPDSELISYDPRSQEFRTFPVPLQAGVPRGYAAPLNTIRFLDGDVWGTGNVSSRVVRLAPDTGKVTQYPSTRGSHPYGIAIANQAVWYITNYNNEIIRLDPDSGKQTSYRPPSPRSGLRRMGADAQGNLWAGGQDSNKLVKLDTRIGQVTEYEVPSKNAAPYSVDVDVARHLIWFSERDGDRIGRFNP